ncbi:MAG: hypothetical protein FWH42_05310 [Dehalococcoidia bacterium]|nr:hypothetical protein [Dehalococcoidia bacterium]
MIATQYGFGHQIIWYQQLLQTNMVMALMVMAGLIGFTIDRGMLFLNRRISKWKYAQAAE